ncbi:hypothetical protein ACS49_03535 [Bacillus cereus]|nr:hypothetical protein ACS49_03535 [Bacillus cereus]
MKDCDATYFLVDFFMYDVNKPPKGMTDKNTIVAIAMKNATMETTSAALDLVCRPAHANTKTTGARLIAKIKNRKPSLLDKC